MKKGQIWVETVIYTLIGLALIGIVLTIIMPKISEFKDKSTIEQTIEVLNVFDSKVNDVLSAPGNVRELELKMRRGDLYVNASEDTIIYELKPLDTKYSEPGSTIEIGNVNVTTTEFGAEYGITLLLNFSEYNLTFDDGEVGEKFSEVSIPYKFIIENRGVSGTENKIQIDIRVS
jgi:type II secretory pathway pseudopilin PulG